MSTKDKMRRARRWALAVLAILAMGVFATRPIASETQDQFWTKTAQCLGWLITDFERHQAECVGPGIGPGYYIDLNGGSNNGGGGGNDGCRDLKLGPPGVPVYDGPCSPCDEKIVGLGAGGPVDPCINVSGYMAPWVLDMFRQDVLETAYL